MRRLKRFKELTADKRSILLRVFAVVAAARAALWVLPLETARQMTAKAASAATGESVEQIVWAVRAASRYVPGASCLTQAIAAQAILAESGFPSQVNIGVAKDHSRFHAHAWVVCQGQIILGGKQVPQYRLLMVWES